MKLVSPEAAQTIIQSPNPIQLIDVRETYENEICSLNGLLIPMNEIPGRVEELVKEKKVIVHCRSGKRSANVIDFLEQNYQLTNLYNLEGGILSWIEEIDSSMESY